MGDAGARPIFDYVSEKSNFEDTFRILNISFNGKVFSFKTKNTIDVAGFSVLQYEAITLGIQDDIARLKELSDEDLKTKLGALLKEMKSDPAYIALTAGGGRNSSGPFKARVKFVTDKVREMLNDS